MTDKTKSIITEEKKFRLVKERWWHRWLDKFNKVGAPPVTVVAEQTVQLCRDNNDNVYMRFEQPAWRAMIGEKNFGRKEWN